jgi:hypothetical protein
MNETENEPGVVIVAAIPLGSLHECFDSIREGGGEVIEMNVLVCDER